MKSQSPKIFFRTNHNFSVNNKDNNYRVYYGTDKEGKARYKQCKDKAEYQKYLTKYICGEKGFFHYSRNEEKSKISMFEYFTGAKKSDSIMEENKMKREQMMMLSNGKFATDEDTIKMQKYWSKYLINSNVHQMVLSFNNDYINENIEIEKLQKETVALIYDFDGTLSPANMQEFGLIQAFGNNPQQFWQKSGKLSSENDASEILCYMKQMIDEAKAKGVHLTKENFRKFG